MDERARRLGRPKIEVYWENPPGPGQGVIVNVVHAGHVYTREVRASGYLTPAEAARAIQRARWTVYRWVKEGRIKTRKVRSRIVIPLSEVKRLLADQRS